MIRTRLTDMFGLQYPVMSAPMAMHSGGRLAAAVSEAGGLGAFGGFNIAGPDWLREQIRLVRQATGRTFGAGFITHFLQQFPMLLDVVVEERVPVVCFSFADPAPYVSKAKDAGAAVVCQVQSMTGAREAVAAGADVLVAQGNEAGGHSGEMNLLPLLVNLLDAFPDRPVLAAGGITNGRALAAVLAAGADGAWAGTAFLATPECVEISEAHKQAVVESDGEDTVYTPVIDIILEKMMGVGWPEGIAARIRREPVVERWHGRLDDLRASIDEAVAEFLQVRKPGEYGPLMGQAAAQVRKVRPAAEVLREICDDAEHILRERPAQVLA
jgi:nitronate monooxygenase